VAIQQAEMLLPPPRDEAAENEQEAEARWHSILLRKMEEAADEVGRERVCYALHYTEGTLSKKLRGADDKVADARLLAYLVKHQKSCRLATWLLRDYAGFLAPQRPEVLRPEQALSEIVAMALAGDMGNAAKEKVVEIYRRTAVKP
jgi:hypothetical protein